MAAVGLQLALVHPGALLRGEVLTAAGHAWTAQPWRGVAERPDAARRANPILTDDMDMFAPWDAHFRSRDALLAPPLWNPGSAGGAPFVANDQSAVFAPLQLPRWIWRSPRARTLGLLLVPLVAAAGMFALLSAWRVRPAAAALGAVAWSCAACLQIWTLYPLAETMAWFSWLAAGATGVLAGRSCRNAWRLAAGAGLGGMLLAGHLPTALQAALVGGLLAVAWCLARPAARLRARALLAPLLAGALLAAPQILTTMEYYGASRQIVVRGSTAGATAAEETLGGEAAWSWLVPAGFGLPQEGGYSGPVNFNEATAWIGALPLLLALCGLLLARRRAAPALALAGLLCVGAACGLLPFGALAAHLPLLAWAPGPRWIVVAQWAACALAGLGADALLRARARTALPRLAVLTALLVGLASLHPAARGDDPAAAASVVSAAGAFLAAGALLALLLYRTRPVAVLLAALFIVVSCSQAFSGFTSSLAPGELPAETDDTRRIAAAVGDGRILSIGWTFPRNTNLLAGLDSVQGWDAVNLERTMRYAETAGWEPAPTQQGRVRMNLAMIRRAGVGVLVSDRPVSGPGLTPLRALESEGLHAFTLAGTHPRVGWYGSAIRVADAEAALARLSRAESIPPGTILVESDGQPRRAASRVEPSALEYERPRSERVLVRTNRVAPGWVVLREAFAPGWRARVDGRARPVVAVDGMFLGVPVPEGPHDVEFSYEPLGWHAGVPAAAVGAAMLALLALFAARRRGRGDAASPL